MKSKAVTMVGTRQGSGAKPKYNEQTKEVAFRCPISKVDVWYEACNCKNDFTFICPSLVDSL